MDEELLGRPALRRAAWMLALSAAIIVLLGMGTVDLLLADWMFDFHIHEFPWQHAWLTEHFSHGTLKTVLTLLATLPVAACAWDSLPDRLRHGRALPAWWRLRLRLLSLCVLLVPAITSLLKRASVSHCPWELERYGGYQPYYRLLEHVPGWVEAGHCLPGGHASSALWLVGLAVFWLPHDPRKAADVGLAALAFGAVVGWMQQMRGAHFLTHTLWTMWIACAVLTALLAAHTRFRAARRSPAMTAA
ncbi:phosphatase PAP2 family protein [Pseudoduganella sp. LjRoot289]|uniref:phosphatase PAP2 family protein n=1 Tax=Pseudoduganella sp. LjRoot289 TaxID=3342314 RepID=UPI003ED0CCF7